MRFWQQALAITWKDILSELRTKEVVSSVGVFALLALVIFNFAFGADLETLRIVAPGILWSTFAFSGILSLNRAFSQEKEENCLEGLMVCPISRETIYVGKMLGSFIFMLVIAAVVLPVFTFLFNLLVATPQLITITVLTTFGFAAVGTLFAALAVNTKAREMVLPILFLPIVVPLIIAAVRASALALAGETWSGIGAYLRLIVAFDVIFAVVAFLVFSYVIEE
ncbi:MAG: heme exporter protein CcmB [Chloroflexota bacterium]